MESRIEKDSMGQVSVANDSYWGAQTQRSLQNFKIGKQTFPRSMIKAMGIVKKACALVNKDLGKLDVDKSQMISDACDEVISGQLDAHFPLVVWQTGSGTQSNMNINEVVSNRAIEKSGGVMGSKNPIHPNDDVNKSQSSNDTFPTFMHIAAVLDLDEKLLPTLEKMKGLVKQLAKKFEPIVKIGRTHMMDATPLTLGQEFSGFEEQLRAVEADLKNSRKELLLLSLGGTAVGTGINTHPEFAKRSAEKIASLTGKDFITAHNKFSSSSSHDAIVACHSSLKRLAVVCMKIANDIRLLASGPRCGLGELILPANEPGSSIMPGKVNPTQCEALTMVAAQVMGNDTAVTIAASQGHLQLNVYKPLLIHNTLESISLLSDACCSFTENCLGGLKANEAVIKEHLNNSLMLVTALNQVLGYDKAAEIAKRAWVDGSTLKEAASQLAYLTEDEFEKYVVPEKMVRP